MKSLVYLSFLVLSFTCTLVAQNGGYAVKFNGTDGYASMTMNTGNTNSTATVEFWFTQVAAQAGTQYIADFHSISGTNNRRVMPYLNNSIIGIFCAPNTGDDNNAITQSTGITVSLNAWYHVAVTINGSTLKMYVNGKLYVTTSLTDAYALTGTEVLTIATDYSNTTYANIKIDEVRVWSTERSEAEIKSKMYKELAGSEAGLLSYYKMSNGSGAALSDNQISGTYGGVLSGGYTWVASGAFAGNRNGLDFDGSNDYVDCGNSASVQRNGTQSFTVEAWVKPTGGIWVAVVSKFVHTASNEGYSLEIFSDNKVALLYGNNWSDWNATTSAVALTSGVWSHIAATYDGSTVKIYINGALDQSATWTNGLTDSGTNLLLGSRSGTTFYYGQMDEARVWTVARTQAEIQEGMCRTLIGNEAGLAAYYRLDQIDGTTTYDPTSNANNGTLTNMDPATDWVNSDAFNTWIGAESSSWATAGNWSKGAVPTSSNSVGIYKWALGNEAAISGTPTINNLFISSAASPTLSSSATVNMNLLLGKDFNLNGQTVTLGSTGNLVEGANRLYGTSGTITTTRTLSNVSVLDVAGLGAKITTAANMGSTTITRGHTQQTGNGNHSILRYYDITPTNNSSLNASLIFNYKDAELNSLTESNFALYRSTDAGTTWVNQGGTLSAVNNTLTKTGIASFSRWTVGDILLPIAGIPDIPVASAATGITTTTFSANWGASIGATKYYLDVSSNNTFSTFVPGYNSLDVGNVVTYSVTSLTPGTKYYYRVRAYNASGTSSSSNTIMAITSLSAPVATAATAITPSSFDAHWNASTGAAGYQLDVATDAGFSSFVSGFNNKDVNNVTVFSVNSGLALGTTYYYRVRAYTTSITSPNSNTISTATSAPPVLAGIEGSTLDYTEGSGNAIITNSLLVSDIDDANLDAAVVLISGNYQNGEDLLDFTGQNGITGTWDASIGKITLSGSASLANYQTALRTVKYRNSSGKPSTLLRTISVTANDGDNNSNTITRTIQVKEINNSPVLTDLENNPLQYVEGSAAVPIANVINVNDVDNSTMAKADVRIGVNYQSNQDVLDFTNQNGITGTWQAETGVLALRGISSATNYLMALRAVKYKNTSSKPDTLHRMVSFTINDGNSSSDTLRREIIVYPVNNAPVVYGIERNVLDFDLGNAPKIISDSIVLADDDHAVLMGAEVNVSKGFVAGEDLLTFEPAQNRSGTYDTTKGVLKISGQDEINNYTLLLRSVRYRNAKGAAATAGIREITFRVWDGIDSSNIGIRQISVRRLQTGVRELSGTEPTKFDLSQNYPNPFNPTTKIRYSIPEAGTVQLKVYSMLGREVATLVHRHMEPGVYEVDFSASNLSSGIYFYGITCNSYSQIKKMIFLK